MVTGGSGGGSGRGGDVAVGGDAEADGLGAAGRGGAGLGEFVVGGGEADLESLGFAGPAFALGFGNAGVEVVADLLQAVPLGGVDPQERAPDGSCSWMQLVEYARPSLDQWRSANKLSNDEHLKAPRRATVTVVGGTTPKQHDGWMWDLTVPGNNDHDFYIDVATAAVLVHNDCAAPRKGGGANDAPSWVGREAGPPLPGETAQQYATRILNEKYGAGNWRRGGGSEYSQIVN